MKMARYELDAKTFRVLDKHNMMGSETCKKVSEHLNKRARRGNRLVNFEGRQEGNFYHTYILWDTSTDMDEATAVRLGLVEAD